MLCDGRPFVEHRLRKGAAVDAAHDCAEVGFAPHVCKPMSPGAIRRVHAILSAALGFAVSWGWIERKPAQHGHPPSSSVGGRSRRSRRSSRRQLINQAWATDAELGLHLRMAVITGGRRGELAPAALVELRPRPALLNSTSTSVASRAISATWSAFVMSKRTATTREP